MCRHLDSVTLVGVVVAEGNPVLSVMAEGYFSTATQTHSACKIWWRASLLKRLTALLVLWVVLHVQEILNSFVATGLPGREFSGTVGELIDVLVLRSGTNVTYLSNPRLITTHESIINLQGINLGTTLSILSGLTIFSFRVPICKKYIS